MDVTIIAEMYAYVTTNPETLQESVVVAYDDETNTHVPLVAARADIAEQWQPLVLAMVEQFQQPVRLVKFNVRDVLDTFRPGGGV